MVIFQCIKMQDSTGTAASKHDSALEFTVPPSDIKCMVAHGHWRAEHHMDERKGANQRHGAQLPQPPSWMMANDIGGHKDDPLGDR